MIIISTMIIIEIRVPHDWAFGEGIGDGIEGELFDDCSGGIRVF